MSKQLPYRVVLADETPLRYLPSMKAARDYITGFQSRDPETLWIQEQDATTQEWKTLTCVSAP